MYEPECKAVHACEHEHEHELQRAGTGFLRAGELMCDCLASMCTGCLCPRYACMNTDAHTCV